MIQQMITSSVCSESGSNNLVEDVETGEAVCHDWGLVIRDMVMDPRPEWRAFALQEKQSKPRTGAPILYSRYGKELLTDIQVSRDAFGKALSAKTRSQRRRFSARVQNLWSFGK